MSELIHGGTMTVEVTDGKAHPVIFSNRGRPILTISLNGEMTIGDGLTASGLAKELGPLLVEEFGKCYGSQLRAALDRISAAEARARRAELDRDNARQKATRIEQAFEEWKKRDAAQANQTPRQQ